MTVSSREVVEKAVAAGRAADIETFVSLMAPEGYIEWPFRPAGVPGRVQGRSAIRGHLTETADTFIRFDEYRNVVTHETTDPEVIIVEYEARGTVVTTGAPFEQAVIAVFRVRAGQILSCRDYLNPLPLAEALTEREALSVADRLAVRELVSLHGHLMDGGEFDRMDELFSADVVYDVSAFGLGELRGHAAISAAGRALGDANPVGHHVTNVVVTEDPDGTVRVRSKGIGIYADGRAGSVVYEDVVRREAAGWRIAYRKVIPRRTPLRSG